MPENVGLAHVLLASSWLLLGSCWVLLASSWLLLGFPETLQDSFFQTFLWVSPWDLYFQPRGSINLLLGFSWAPLGLRLAPHGLLFASSWPPPGLLLGSSWPPRGFCWAPVGFLSATRKLPPNSPSPFLQLLNPLKPSQPLPRAPKS